MAAASKKDKSPKAGGLGRGLGALLGDTPPLIDDNVAPGTDEAAAVKRSTRTLPIEFLEANPDQPRRTFNEDALAELTESIKTRGLLQPILVRPKGTDKYEIVAGERRWRAAQRARLHEVPVVVRELTDSETAEIALIENVQRVDLNAVEEAQAYQRLSDHFGRTQSEIAKAVGKSRSHVANIMRLLVLPPACLDAVRDNQISMCHARALIGMTNADEALKTVLKDQLSVRQTEKMAQAESAEPRRITKRSAAHKNADSSKPKDADTRAVENDLAAALGLVVSITHSKSGAGEVSVKYLNLDQLDEVTRRLMGTAV